jgi:hypothetical protein
MNETITSEAVREAAEAPRGGVDLGSIGVEAFESGLPDEGRGDIRSWQADRAVDAEIAENAGCTALGGAHTPKMIDDRRRQFLEGAAKRQEGLRRDLDKVSSNRELSKEGKRVRREKLIAAHLEANEKELASTEEHLREAAEVYESRALATLNADFAQTEPDPHIAALRVLNFSVAASGLSEDDYVEAALSIVSSGAAWAPSLLETAAVRLRSDPLRLKMITTRVATTANARLREHIASDPERMKAAARITKLRRAVSRFERVAKSARSPDAATAMDIELHNWND